MTGAVAVVIFFCGLGVGVFGTVAVLILAQPPGRCLLPPSTRRAIRRERRQLADIRPAIARGRKHDERHWLPPSIDTFDHEETQ